MPQIFDVTANENARYKRNKLEYFIFTVCKYHHTNTQLFQQIVFTYHNYAFVSVNNYLNYEYAKVSEQMVLLVQVEYK